MSLVNVMINAKAYTIACDDGEEEHLKALGTEVDNRVRELLGAVGNVGEQRLLLMAALLLADELHAATTERDAAKKNASDERDARTETSDRLSQAEAKAADVLELAIKRIEAIAAKLKAA